MRKAKAFAEFDIAETTPVDILDIVASSITTSSNSTAVPNRHPTISQSYRIAIIGEAPGEHEINQLTPFVGPSGRLLNEKLSQANLLRDACFIGNICQRRPPNNDISFFSRSGDEMAEGLQRLAVDLQAFRPNICLLLGKTALWFARGVDAISDWRGSLFISDREGPFLGRKCLATFHPAACMRQWEWTPLLLFDIKRAKEESLSPELVLPTRDLITKPDFFQLIHLLDEVIEKKLPVSPDIEGGLSFMPCLSLATAPDKSFIVPFANLDGSPIWSIDDELVIWQRLCQIMADAEIKKTWQNGLYDRFVLQYGYNVFIAGNYDDTMLKFWEMYCELEKGLGFQNSILNKEPYYKFERKIADQEVFFKYCCKDSATTFENNARLERLLDPAQHSHYRRNIELLNPLLYMELRGIRYDIQLAKARLKEVNEHVYRLQAELDILAGSTMYGLTKDELKAVVQDVMCYKRDTTRAKAQYLDDYDYCSRLLLSPSDLTTWERARIITACGGSMNIKSKQFKTYLYETLQLPKQYKENPQTKEKALTTDYEALLRLSKQTDHQAVSIALQLGVLRTRAQMLEIHADGDKRIRCGYNIVGTETGRLTSYTSPTGSGYNLQTIPAENTLLALDSPIRPGMRDLFTADEGHFLFQCDLSGADGWTIGAYLSMLGDSTMLDDLRAGLKPARVICFMLRHGTTALAGKTRPEIAELLKEVKKEDWDYFACKVGIWGTCYTMGPRKLSTVFLIQSEGKLSWTESETRTFQQAVHARYRIKLWHDWAMRQIKQKPELVAPNGFKRRFFGRFNEILGEYLAHLPQVITTYATNTALYNLWTDPENRQQQSVGEGLRVEPLHQVHDALVGQFRIEDTAWAISKIEQWFDNPVIIAGQTIKIPFEGSYGTNWALDDKSKVGTI